MLAKIQFFVEKYYIKIFSYFFSEKSETYSILVDKSTREKVQYKL